MGGGHRADTEQADHMLFVRLNWRRVLSQRERAEEGRAISSRR